MQRRTLIKAGFTVTLAGLWGIPKARASCHLTFGLPASMLGTSIEEPIEALFDREYGAEHWQFSKDMALQVTHPDKADDERTIGFNIRLTALPPGMTRCIQVEIYRRNKVSLISRIDNGYRRSNPLVNYRVARCHPANVLPMEFGTRYRSFRGKTSLYVALSFLTQSGAVFMQQDTDEQ